MVRHLVFSIFISLFVGQVWGANILYMALTASPSHTIWDKTIIMELRKNHNITFVSHGPVIKSENVTSILFEGVYEKMHQVFEIEEMCDNPVKFQCDILVEWMHTQSTFDVETNGLKFLLKQIEEGTRYDLIMWDLTTGHFLLPIIEKLGFPPVIATSAFGASPFYATIFGYEVNSAYIPLWMMEFTDQMTFSQRAYNFIASWYAFYDKDYWYMFEEQKLAEKVFGKLVPPLRTYEKKFSLLLINSDPILDYPQPYPPQVIQVGGLHIKRVEELPKDLRDYIEKSKNGVILFCLGTNIRSDFLAPEKRETIIKALGRLKQNVIWKFESDIEGLPKNVIVRKWIPQNEILAHPNVKLFVSHGGALSTQEAIHHGVPVVGIPFLFDQHVNIRKFINRKIGEKINYLTMTEIIIYDTINKVLTDPIYSENMKKMSRRYRDQPQNPLDRAVFWVEYVLRQGGAEHLRVAARDMSIVELYHLDFWALVAVSLLGFSYMIRKILFGKNSQKLKEKTS